MVGFGRAMLVVIAAPLPGRIAASPAQVLSRLSWTPPTLVQDRLYIRDRASVMALHLGR